MTSPVRFAAILATLCSACLPNLELADDVKLECAGDRDCPLGRKCGSAGLCIPDGNAPPALTVGVVPRAAGPVDLSATVSDEEAEPLTLSAEWRRGAAGDFVAATIEPTVVEASPDQSTHSLRWTPPASLDPASFHDDIYLRVSASDGSTTVATTTDAFEFGNETPTISNPRVDVPANGIVTGVAVLRFDATDSTGDPLSVIDAVFTLTGSFDPPDEQVIELTTGLVGNFPTGSLDGLPTAAEVAFEHSFGWNTALLLPAQAAAEVTVGMVITDDFGGATTVVFPAFALDNTVNIAAEVAVTTPTGPGLNGDIIVSLTISDIESDTVDLVVEVLTAGGEWVLASEPSGEDRLTGLATSPIGVDYDIIWDSVADDIALSALDDRVQLRIAARAGTSVGAYATTDPFEIDNRLHNQAPAITILNPNDPISGEAVVINYLLSDDEGDPCDVTVEVWSDDGVWVPAIGGLGGDGLSVLSSSVGLGDLHTFVWDSVAPQRDVGGTPLVNATGQWIPTASSIAVSARGDVALRMQPRQSSPAPDLTGAWAATTGNFEADNGDLLNTPPRVRLRPAPARAPRAAPIFFDIMDDESDFARIAAFEVSTDGFNWLRASLHTNLGEGLGDLTTGHATDPSGVLHVLSWDAPSDAGLLGGDGHVQLRLAVEDRYHRGDYANSALVTAVARLWEADTLSTNSGGRANPTSAIGPDGALHAAWANNDGDIEYRTTRDGGVTWSVPLVFSRDAWDSSSTCPGGASNNSGLPSLLADADGLHLLFRETAGGVNGLWYLRSTDAGATWSCPPVDISDGGATSSHTIASGGGRLVVAWGFTPELRVSDDGGLTWIPDLASPPASAPLSGLPAVAVANDGRIYLATQDTDIAIARSDDGGNSWPMMANVATGVDQGVELSVSPSGSVHLVWRATDFGGEAREILHARSTDLGVTWATPWVFPIRGARPELVAGPSGQLLISWVKPLAGQLDPTELFTSVSSDDGLSWSVPIGYHGRLPDVASSLVAIPGFARAAAVRANGEIELVVHHEPESGSSEVLHFSTLAELEPWPFDQILDRATSPHLAAGTDGSVHVVGYYAPAIRYLTSHDSGVSWAPAVDVGTPAINGNSPLTVAGSPAHILYKPATQITLAHVSTADQGITWSAPHGIGALSSGSARVMRGPDGSLHLLTITTVPTDLVHTSSTDGGATWSSPVVTFTATAVNSTPQALLISADGTLHALYSETNAQREIFHRSSNDDGANWSSAQLVASPSLSEGFALDDLDNIHGVWQDDADQIWSSLSDDGGTTWSAPVSLSGHLGVLSVESLIAGPDGVLHVILGASDATLRAVSRDRGSTWSLPEPLYGETDTLVAAAGADGTLWVAYSVINSGETQVGRAGRAWRLEANIPLPIPIPDDGSEALVAFDVLVSVPIDHLSVYVAIRHPDRGELTVELTHDAQTVVLHDGGEGGKQNLIRLYGDGVPTASTIANGSLDAAFAGSLVGTWELRVRDNVGGNAGTIESWSLGSNND